MLQCVAGAGMALVVNTGVKEGDYSYSCVRMTECVGLEPLLFELMGVLWNFQDGGEMPGEKTLYRSFVLLVQERRACSFGACGARVINLLTDAICCCRGWSFSS